MNEYLTISKCYLQSKEDENLIIEEIKNFTVKENHANLSYLKRRSRMVRTVLSQINLTSMCPLSHQHECMKGVAFY